MKVWPSMRSGGGRMVTSVVRRTPSRPSRWNRIPLGMTSTGMASTFGATL